MSDHNVTVHRFQCPQTFPDSNCGGPLPGDIIPPAFDEFNCLILQLNIPLAHLQTSAHPSKLPVLVYIHGGGFVLGGINEEHNTALMTEQSILDGQPIITANIQYRLGALGYLHTPEAGSTNLALHDQRNALLWIQKFIGGFRGDAKNVSLFGESGGSISICSQMLFAPPPSGPLFRRVILMSGVLGSSVAPCSVEEANAVYETFLTKLGIEERGTDALEKLRALDLQKIVEATAAFVDSGLVFRTVHSKDWFEDDGEFVGWERFPEWIGKCEWVDEIMIGTTSFEVRYHPALLSSKSLRCFDVGHNVHTETLRRHTTGFPCRYR
jgi:carboxylesterase type B